MSTHHWLICEDSGEMVEVVASVGRFTTPRIDPNVLGAFLQYHQIAYPGAVMRVRDADSINKQFFDSEDERDTYGTKLDVIAWNKQNYWTLAARNPEAKAGLEDIEGAGRWVWTRT